jgi:hypothetical protein
MIRTLDPLIKSPDREQSTDTQEDLSAGHSDDHD